MPKPTVAIVGLGQIGGSLAAALSKRRLARVIGVARRPETARRALRMRIVEEAGTDLAAVSTADIVVLATPVRTILGQIPRVLPHVRPDAVLTDVGSTKAEIMRTFHRLKPRMTVVGGHPMAGNERVGLDGCDPDLFRDRPWILVPFSGKVLRTAASWVRLIRAVGARPIWRTDPLEHDLSVARISHIPYLIAYALTQQPDRIFTVAGNSFRDATRVALSDVDMVLDFLLTNRGPVRRAARDLERRLRELVGLVTRGDERALRKRLEAARSRRQKIQ